MPHKDTNLKSNKNEFPNNKVKELSLIKKIIFWIILFSIPVLLFFLLEIVLRIVDYGGNTKLFVSNFDKSNQHLNINPDVCKRYFNFNDFTPSPRVDLLRKRKPYNGYRIFVLGGSSAAGYPYGNNLTFSRILHRRLTDVFPDKKIEIINLAMTAVNSYTMLDFMDEIIEQKPDAILIYAGHNEYYGAMGVSSMESIGKYRRFVKTYLKIQELKTFNLIRNTAGKIKRIFNRKLVEKYESDPSKTLMSRIAKNPTVFLNSPIYELGKKQFEGNLKDIITNAQEEGIAVILSELVSNVKDLTPFSAEKTDTLPSARDIFNQARLKENNGEYQEAYHLYAKAKNLDPIRFRAPDDFNTIIQNISNEFELPIVPMKKYFESESPNKLIGDNLMTDHLHPTNEGYFIMADAFFNTMWEHNFISDNWKDENIKPESYYINNWGFSKLDSVYASYSVIHLKGDWPFKENPGRNDTILKHPKKLIEDTFAIKLMQSEELTLEWGHLNLGRYYENKGEYERALEEYKALIYILPQIDVFYEPAIQLLVKTKQYYNAKILLMDAIKYCESALIYAWIGQISYALNDDQNTILYLDKSIALNPSDQQSLFYLAKTYYKLKQIDKGDVVLSQLKRNNPTSQFIRQLEEYKQPLSN